MEEDNGSRMPTVVRTKIDMKRVFPKGSGRDKVFDDAIVRWGGNVSDVSDASRRSVMIAMREQVEARFAYDYKASFNMQTGEIAFPVGDDGDWDESNEDSRLWSLNPRRGRSGGLTPDKHGDTLDDICRQCERICRDYAWVALSYSAAGVLRG